MICAKELMAGSLLTTHYLLLATHHLLLTKGADMIYARELMTGSKYSHDTCLKASWSIDETVDFWEKRRIA